VPVKVSTGPLRDAWEPPRLISMMPFLLQRQGNRMKMTAIYCKARIFGFLGVSPA
jgi:hypothetical protein